MSTVERYDKSKLYFYGYLPLVSIRLFQVLIAFFSLSHYENILMHIFKDLKLTRYMYNTKNNRKASFISHKLWKVVSQCVFMLVTAFVQSRSLVLYHLDLATFLCTRYFQLLLCQICSNTKYQVFNVLIFFSSLYNTTWSTEMKDKVLV